MVLQERSATFLPTITTEPGLMLNMLAIQWDHSCYLLKISLSWYVFGLKHIYSLFWDISYKEKYFRFIYIIFTSICLANLNAITELWYCFLHHVPWELKVYSAPHVCLSFCSVSSIFVPRDMSQGHGNARCPSIRPSVCPRFSHFVL